jgi:hypothetical protein
VRIGDFGDVDGLHLSEFEHDPGGHIWGKLSFEFVAPR